MARKSVVRLTEEERERLRDLSGSRQVEGRVRTRARILLMDHEGAADRRIAQALHVGTATVRQVRERFLEGGLEAALGTSARRASPPDLPSEPEASPGTGPA